MRQLVDQFQVDGVLDTGDITDWGSAAGEPADRLASGTLGVPYVYIRGNHDSATTAAPDAAQPNATVLDDSAVTVAGIEIVGAPDPRFTPDKSTGDDDAGDDVLTDPAAARRLRRHLPDPPAIAHGARPEAGRRRSTASSRWSWPGTPTSARSRC